MRNVLLLILIYLLITIGCSNREPTRDIAISLIEKTYPENGRKTEYSQIDSTDAELQGYSIFRVYVNNDDLIKLDCFHLNYNKTKVNLEFSYPLELHLYKSLLIEDKIFTNDVKADIKKIQREKDIQYDNITDDMRKADSIACVEATSIVF